MLHLADDRPASRDTRELEAEAVAFVVGEAVGLQVAQAAVDCRLGFIVSSGGLSHRRMEPWLKTIRRRVCVIALTWIACAPSAFGQIVPADADHRDYWSDWFERVDRTQAAQPHWMTPLATTTPRLEEEWRSDVFVMPRPDGTVDNIGGGKGPSVIPFERVEIIVSPPPYLHHRDAPSTDGFGDAGMLVKYRLVAANEHRGNLKGALIQRRPCVEWDDV